MIKTLPVLVIVAIVLAGGIAHGVLTNRWNASPEPAASAARLEDVPLDVGDWVGREGEPLDTQSLAVGEIVGALSRKYVHRQTGKTVNVLIVCGRPGPIGAHTPEVCFVGAGREMTRREKSSFTVPSTQARAEFHVANFRSHGGGTGQLARAFWAWSYDGTWKAPDRPRWEFAGRHALFKIYVLHGLVSEQDPIVEDEAIAFLKVMIPELNHALFEGR